MRKIKFTVPGSPVGFKTTTKRAKYASKGYRAYVEYKKLVQFYARSSGIRLPLKATKDHPLIIKTISYFKNGTHPDPGNVQKGVVDALFYREERLGKSTGKGDDKFTGGGFPPPLYDKNNPRVIIIIKDYKPKRKKR